MCAGEGAPGTGSSRGSSASRVQGGRTRVSRSGKHGVGTVSFTEVAYGEGQGTQVTYRGPLFLQRGVHADARREVLPEE